MSAVPGEQPTTGVVGLGVISNGVPGTWLAIARKPPPTEADRLVAETVPD
ncbi:hypothetical protein GCM10022222_00880 [Amycolatopsis ultiminotia]|uniref:Uncharacterized protein n=1 Tax=Amycolatopsis ultiminotia TaxID=543629 RepID=A0ABP6UVA4_9PSEU